MSAVPRALLKLGYACNNNCVFCHAAPHRGVRARRGNLERKIRRAAALGARMVVFSGGEPTVHAGWLELADLVAALGLRLGLVTNGRMLAYAGLVERLVARGLEYAYVSLSGPDAALHDRHAGARAFDQTLAGLRALAPRVAETTANVVVTRRNLARLEDFVELLDPLPSVRLKFSLVEPAGNALDDFDGLVPPLAAAARAIRSAIALARRRRPGRPAVWDGLPLCHAGSFADLECALREDGFAWMSEAFERDWFPVDDRHRAFADVCRVCSLRRRCRGVFVEYLAHRGAAELRPASRAVSNSFHWVPAPRDERLDPRACPIRAGRRPPPDPIRGILVRTGPRRARRHETATRDFSDETLRRAVREQEQVYAAAGPGPLVTDFAAQLRRLRLAPACRRCPARRLCGGLFAARPGPAFARAQAILDRLLRGLHGTLLDVGCGSAPYRAALAPAVRAGRLRYLGLDPQAPAGRQAPGFEFLRGTLERFRRSGPPFDAALALRSLAHLPQPERSLRRLGALVRPGGTLLLAEDVVFGLVRDAASLRRVERRDDLPFEHRTNLTVEEAAAIAADAGWRETRRWTAGGTASTLWILKLERKRGRGG